MQLNQEIQSDGKRCISFLVINIDWSTRRRKWIEPADNVDLLEKFKCPSFFVLISCCTWPNDEKFFLIIAVAEDCISFAVKKRSFITDYGQPSVDKSRNISVNGLIVNRFVHPDEMEESVEWCRIARILGYRSYRPTKEAFFLSPHPVPP